MSNLAIVTGASRGIGLAAAEKLARLGWNLNLVSSNRERLSAVAKQLSDKFPGIEVAFTPIDFSNLDAVREGARLLPEGWDLLINNAGVKVVEGAGTTAQDHEWHLGINHLAPFLLTLGLLPTANRGARVTTVASIVARIAAPENLEAPDLDVSALYARSKLMNLVFAIELNERMRASSNPHLRSMSSTAAHPGFTRASRYGKSYVRPAEYLFAQSTRFGAMPIVDAALATVTNSSEFTYLGPRHFELWGRTKPAIAPERASDSDFRQRIWSLSENLSGHSGDYLV